MVRKEKMRELSFRGIVLGALLAMILAAANTFLALKLGILSSASIPAAVMAMGLLRFFKNSSILENNAVQTAASAGEAVAGGVVYTIPALIIIGYWNHFDYLTNFSIAALGGILGVLFSIPLRRLLVNDASLPFPEGQAIAALLNSSNHQANLKEILWGGGIAALIELLQLGFKLVASHWTFWFTAFRSLFFLGIGFSPTLIGAGFLMGPRVAMSVLGGAISMWLVDLPLLSPSHADISKETLGLIGHDLWTRHLRYIALGAMLCAGVLAFSRLLKPLLRRIVQSLENLGDLQKNRGLFSSRDQDIPVPYILMAIALLSAFLFLFFQFNFPLDDIGFNQNLAPTLIFGAVLYVLVFGALFAVITAYFSGMVGVTASPGSSIVISGILFAAWLLMSLMNTFIPSPFNPAQMNAAAALVIMIGAVVTGIGAIANDNIQDLKVGQLIGATPWKQELMLLLGVLVSALVIPWVMDSLFEVYGIAGVVPRAGMDLSKTLPAPPAALLAAIAEAMLTHQLPWMMFAWGVLTIFLLLLTERALKLYFKGPISILGFAIGMYLPLESSTALFLGGFLALSLGKQIRLKVKSAENQLHSREKMTMIACGLVAGAALMDVILAFIFSIKQSADALALVPESFEIWTVVAAFLLMGILARLIKIRVLKF